MITGWTSALADALGTLKAMTHVVDPPGPTTSGVVRVLVNSTVIGTTVWEKQAMRETIVTPGASAPRS